MPLLFLFLVLILFLLFWSRPHWGLYLVVFLAPFLGLVVDFSRFEWARDIPYLSNLDGPIADFAVLVLLGVVIVKTVAQSFLPYKGRSGGVNSSGRPPLTPPDRGRITVLTAILPTAGFFYFLPFLLVGVLSLFNVPYDQFGASLKYLLRPILFFYLMWVVLPVVLIDSEKILDKIIKIIFWTGVLAALMGLVSLFISPVIFGFWRRAGPIEFWGLAPLAFNHNLLAEWLVAVAPLGFYLFAWSMSLRAERSNPIDNGIATGRFSIGPCDDLKKIYFLGFILITAIALLTFARAAWLALAAQAVIYYLLTAKRSHFVPCHSRESGNPENQNLAGFPVRPGMTKMWPFLLIIIPLFVYMLVFSLSPLVRSSNATRLDLTGISWTYFKLHPWLGNGVGTFVPLVEQTRLFTVEYGDPLDAHGILQKLAAEQGLLGLITFSLFIGWIIHRLYQAIRLAVEKHHLLLLCLFLSVTGSLVYQLFNTSYYNQHLWLVVGVGLAGTRIFKKY